MGVSRTILKVPIVRIIVFWGLYWGPPILGNYHNRVFFIKVQPQRAATDIQGLGTCLDTKSHTLLYSVKP